MKTILASLVWALLLPEGPQQAAPAEIARTLVLTWRAPASCPDEAALRAQIERALFEEAAGARTTGLEVEASVVAREGGYSLALRLRLRALEHVEHVEHVAQEEATQVSAGSCRVLVEFVALKVALALNPAFSFEIADTPDKPGAPTHEPLPSSVSDATRERPRSASQAPPRGFAQLLAAVGAGTLHAVDTGPALAFGVEAARWRASLDVHSLFSPAIRPAELEPGGVRLLYPGVRLAGCYQFHDRRAAIPLCASVEGGAVRAAGFGLDVDRVVWRPYVGAGAEVGLLWPHDARVRLVLRLGANATIVAPTFHVDGVGSVHRSGPASGRLLAGVEFVLSRERSETTERSRRR